MHRARFGTEAESNIEETMVVVRSDRARRSATRRSEKRVEQMPTAKWGRPSRGLQSRPLTDDEQTLPQSATPSPPTAKSKHCLTQTFT